MIGGGTRGGEGLRVCVKVESVDEFYEGVRSKGLEPTSEPRQGSVGREFVLRDPDEYELVCFEKEAVGRRSFTNASARRAYSITVLAIAGGSRPARSQPASAAASGTPTTARAKYTKGTSLR